MDDIDGMDGMDKRMWHPYGQTGHRFFVGPVFKGGSLGDALRGIFERESSVANSRFVSFFYPGICGNIPLNPPSKGDF